MSIGWQQILILVLIAVLLFGAKKLPDLARSLGRSARILRAETKGLADEDETGGEAAASGGGTQQSAAGQHQPSSAGPGAPQHGPEQPPAPQHGDYADYRELPPGARVVDETGEPVRYYGENRP